MVKKSYKDYEESWRSTENCKEWGDWCKLDEELYLTKNTELRIMN